MAGLQVFSGSLLKGETSDEGQEDHYAGDSNAAAAARCVLPFYIKPGDDLALLGGFGRPQKTDVQLESQVLVLVRSVRVMRRMETESNRCLHFHSYSELRLSCPKLR